MFKQVSWNILVVAMHGGILQHFGAREIGNAAMRHLINVDTHVNLYNTCALTSLSVLPIIIRPSVVHFAPARQQSIHHY